MSNLSPKEVIHQRGCEERFASAFGNKLYTYKLDEWVFSYDINRDKLCKQFGTQNLKGFGVEHMRNGMPRPVPYFITLSLPNTVT